MRSKLIDGNGEKFIEFVEISQVYLLFNCVFKVVWI